MHKYEAKNDIPDKKDADAGVVLRADETEVVLQVIQASLGDGVAIEVVLLLASIAIDHRMLAL
jgi:hypothetical protein